MPLALAPMQFDHPPLVVNGEGRMRTVGVEVEFAGLSAAAAAKALADELGGAVTEKDPHAYAVDGSAIGDFCVELDSRYAHPDSAKALLGEVGATLAPWFGAAASLVLPCELVTGPVPLDRLPELDRAVAALRRAGARGTHDAAIYAFGLHLNPEAPRLEAETTLAVLKAFVLLAGWLRRQTAPDATREFLGFADPFPEAYMRRIVDRDYWPALPEFIDDYLAHNPTRNRDLDLLPLLTFLDEPRVRAALPAEKIGKRPTFHYRLPDARVSDPGWSIAPDWNRWVAVERLAADRDRLGEVGAAYLAFEGTPKSWADLVERIALA
jgi:hypothetical protein